MKVMMAKINIKKEEVNIIWSDDPDVEKKKNNKQENEGEVVPSDFLLEIRRETKKRGGKTVSVIFGEMEQNKKYFKKLTQELKKKCGTGGSFKGICIEIQGDFIDDIKAHLESIGFKVKKVGG